MDILSLFVVIVVIIAICYMVNKELKTSRKKDTLYDYDESDCNVEVPKKEPQFVTLSFGTDNGLQEVIMDEEHFWDNVAPVLNDHGWFDDGNGNWYNLEGIKNGINVYNGRI